VAATTTKVGVAFHVRRRVSTLYGLNYVELARAMKGDSFLPLSSRLHHPKIEAFTLIPGLNLVSLNKASNVTNVTLLGTYDT
jgi:hypothetical protein